jgi:hypothetical protein
LEEATPHAFPRRSHFADYYHHSWNGGLARDRNCHSHPPQEAGFLWPPLPGKHTEAESQMHHTPQAPHSTQAQPQAAAFQDGKASPMEYLRQILTARIYDIARVRG